MQGTVTKAVSTGASMYRYSGQQTLEPRIHPRLAGEHVPTLALQGHHPRSPPDGLRRLG